MSLKRMISTTFSAAALLCLSPMLLLIAVILWIVKLKCGEKFKRETSFANDLRLIVKTFRELFQKENLMTK